MLFLSVAALAEVAIESVTFACVSAWECATLADGWLCDAWLVDLSCELAMISKYSQVTGALVIYTHSSRGRRRVEVARGNIERSIKRAKLRYTRRELMSDVVVVVEGAERECGASLLGDRVKASGTSFKRRARCRLFLFVSPALRAEKIVRIRLTCTESGT